MFDVDTVLWIVKFIIGVFIGHYAMKLLMRTVFSGRKIIEDDPDEEAELIASYPKIKVETVEHKGTTIYLLNEYSGKFLGQSDSSDGMKELISKKFGGKTVIFVSEDNTTGRIVTVSEA